MRDVQFKMLLTRSEREALTELAKCHGVTASDYLRRFIRYQYDKIEQKRKARTAQIKAMFK